eukprot:361852_1
MAGTLPLHGTAWIWFLLILSTIMLLLSIIVVIMSIQVSVTIKKIHRTTAILILFCTLSYLGINFTDSLGFLFWSPDFFNDANGSTTDQSNNTYMMYTVFWALAKLSLYLVYLYRLYSVYNGTKYAFGRIIYIVVAVLWCVQCCLLIGWLYLYNIIWICCEDAATEFWGDDGVEVYATWNNLCWLMLSMDLILTVLIMSLFLVSMKRVFNTLKLMEAQAAQMHNAETANTETRTEGLAPTKTDSNSRLKHLLDSTTKLMLLGAISLVSSIVYQLIFAISLTEWFGYSEKGTDVHIALWYTSYTWSLDNFINIICLYLTLPSPITHKYYEKWCESGFKCHPCCLQRVKSIVL